MMQKVKDILGGDILSGVLAGLAVAPMAAIVEKAMFSAASGKMPYNTSFKECAKQILISPVEFFRRRTFKLCFLVYASTFVTANCADRIARLFDLNVNVTTLCAVSLVKITLNLHKDTYMTKKYCLPKTKRTPVSRGTLVCYAIRDMITIVGAFICIEPVAERIQKYVHVYPLAKITSQTVCPMVAQLLSTPFFIYGIDLYNRPKARILSRLWLVERSYWNTYYWSRMTRVGPAYSVGGILNIIFRFCLAEPLPEKKKENDVEDDEENLFSQVKYTKDRAKTKRNPSMQN